MNHLHHALAQPAATLPLRGLPSARALALMAQQLRCAADELRADQRHDGVDPIGTTDACGPGWFESSFELGRGLLVLEGPAGLADEWLRLGGLGGGCGCRSDERRPT